MIMIVVDRLVAIIVIIIALPLVGIFGNRPNEGDEDENDRETAHPETVEKIPVHFLNNFCHQVFFGGT